MNSESENQIPPSSEISLADKKGPDVAHLKVPEALLQRMRDANARFHEVRGRWETMMGNTEYRHQERIDQVAEELKRAQREVEEVGREIEAIVDQPR